MLIFKLLHQLRIGVIVMQEYALCSVLINWVSISLELPNALYVLVEFCFSNSHSRILRNMLCL